MRASCSPLNFDADPPPPASGDAGVRPRRAAARKHYFGIWRHIGVIISNWRENFASVSRENGNAKSLRVFWPHSVLLEP